MPRFWSPKPHFAPLALAAFLVLGAASSTAWAARDFTPQAGTWVISEELNGQPGRGLAIDVQGNTFVMQVFGYEKNGDATFYTAIGHMEGNSVTAPLVRYQGGRSFGSDARDAVEDKSLGDVTVSFQNGLKGTVQFPGEPAMAMKRFLVQSDQAAVTNPRMQTGSRGFKLLALNPQGDVAYHWAASMSRTPSGTFRLTLSQYKFLIMSNHSEAFQELDCQLEGSRTLWACKAASDGPYIDINGKPVGGPRVESLRFELAGYDLAGSVQMGDAQTGVFMTLTGYDGDASEIGGKRREGHTTWTTHIQQNYQQSSFSSGGVCTLECYSSEYINTLMPFNGTWIVEDERTGKPGRGLALDIQGNTAILQVFNYRANQQPTFHMGSAVYASKGLNSLATQATIPMDEYAGGRSIGGAAQSARLRTQAGDATLEFAYQNADWTRPMEEWMWWTSGQVQLPGESPVRIRRLQLERPQSFADKMLGQWFLLNPQTTVNLVRVEGDAVMTADGSVVCKPAISSPGQVNNSVHCDRLTEPQTAGWNLDMKLPLMNRGGDMIRLRDRHGNAVGLGQLD